MEIGHTGEATPLVADVVSSSAAASEEEALGGSHNFPHQLPGNSRSRRHTRDVHFLSLAFLFVFSAYHAAQNLESSINTEQDLGTTSMGILYLSFMVFSLFGSPIVRSMGLKAALVVGTTGYWLFIASNLRPSWYTMVPASIYLGFGSSIIWVGQGAYLTSVARSFAKELHMQEGTVIGNFNGEFWGMFASTQVTGNLVSLLLLRDGKGGKTAGTTLLFTIFLGSITLGTVFMCFLSQRNDKKESIVEYSVRHSSIWSLLKPVVLPLSDKRMLLIIPLLAYSGLQQSFVWAEFTKQIITPALGVSGVGAAMAVYGAFDATCSLVAGRVTTGVSSVTFIICVGAFLEMIVLFWLLLGYSLSSGLLGRVIPLFMAGMLGTGNGILNTQICTLLGMLFHSDMEAAFAQLKVWQSMAIALVFFWSPYITFQAMSIAMVVTLCISIPPFLYLTSCMGKISHLQT